jgi:hypothetical protein
MKTAVVLAALAACSLALPSTPRFSKRQAGPTQDQVVTAIDSWNTDVAMVNSFLNTPSTTGAEYGALAQTTLGFASDVRPSIACISPVNANKASQDPNELMILASIPGLADDATAAIANLMGVFGNVLNALQSIIDNQNNLNQINIEIGEINQVRCCSVLPDLDVLWTAAADDEGVSNLVNLVVPRENACATVFC